jgi:cytochrome P450
MQVAELTKAARFVGGIYTERAKTLWSAKVRGDLFSQLNVQPATTDPYPIYEAMRARGPLLPTRFGNYSTTSYALSREVVRNRRFGVVPSVESGQQTGRDFLDLSLLNLDPPDHTRIRRLAAPGFSPKRMDGYAGMVAQAVDEVLDDAEHQGEFDLMSTVASPLPIAVITRLLGLPDEDPTRLRYLGSTIAKALDGISSLTQARRLAAAEKELRGVFDVLVAEKLRHPGPDLTSALVAEQGEAITADELMPLVRVLLVAGFETTVNAIGNGVRWLLADREQWELLVADPSLAEQVAEEVLRFDPPVQATARVAQEDIELGGAVIRPDQWVITLLGAANRDPDVYPDPNRFDVTRDHPAEHLAFSGGIHYCIGSPLARMELVQTFRSLAERFPRLRSTGPITMRHATTLRGPLSVPLATH